MLSGPSAGAPVVSFDKVAALDPGRKIAVEGRVPENLELFGDHFPGFAVLPGVLAIDLLKQAAERCEGGPKPFALKSVSQVKFMRFLRPGDAWGAEVEKVREAGTESHWKAALFSGGVPAVSARFVLQT
jgi:3-hydroxyacyl-[acyl-carrier-protein] dehydratase